MVWQPRFYLNRRSNRRSTFNYARVTPRRAAIGDSALLANFLEGETGFAKAVVALLSACREICHCMGQAGQASITTAGGIFRVKL